MGSSDILSSLPANGLLTMILVPIITWLRNNKRVTGINDKTVFWFAGFCSFCAALGIHGAVSSSGFHFEGTWKELGDGLFDVVKQWSALHWGNQAQQIVKHLPDFLKSVRTADGIASAQMQLAITNALPPTPPVVPPA